MQIDNERKEAEYRQAETPTQQFPYVVQVRFNGNSRSYSFGTFLEDLKQGDKVVVETVQGMELGVVETAATSTDIYPQNRFTLKPVLRKADEEDVLDYEENLAYAEEAYEICQQEIKALGLGMRLLSAEYMLDRTKVLFVYQSDERVDFRELLKKLSARLHCRIELRQIGERDKAKMVGGIGVCGRELCCARFKNKMDVISINMAKNQLLALNTEKLSGMCGKLMCCLKYEDDVYKELTEGLPKMGAHVEYEGDIYRVSSMNVIANIAHLENSETFQIITLDDLREKGVVRKGVTVSRKNVRGQSKQVKVSQSVKENQEIHAAFNATNSEKTRGISDVSKDTSHQEQAQLHLKPENKLQPRSKSNNNARKNDYGNNRKASNNNNSRHHENVRRPNHNDTNNPNVTVRSFKSKKTLEKEANKEN